MAALNNQQEIQVNHEILLKKVIFRISLLNLDKVDQTEILYENVLFSGKMKARYFLGLLVLISECLYLCEANGVYLHSPHGSCNRGIKDLKDVSKENQNRLFTSNVSVHVFLLF